MVISNRVILIGGAPRIGKSQLAKIIAARLGGHIASTDSIRSAAKRMVKDESSPIFRINRHNAMSESEWLDYFSNNPDAVLADMNEESRATWPAVRSFIRSFEDDDLVHVVEGVHLLPDLVGELSIDTQNIIFVGNTFQEHASNVINHAKDNPTIDWMMGAGFSDEKIMTQAQFSIDMSQYFKTEAKKYGYKYIELGNSSYPQNLQKIAKTFPRP